MKKIFFSVTIFILGFALVTVTSCKKDSNSTNNCVIKTLIHESSGVFDTTNYSYNNDKKVIAVVSGTSHVAYNYFGNSVNRYSTSGSSTYRDSIVYGSNGFIAENYEFDNAGVKQRRNVYTYDSQNKLTQLTTTEYPSMLVTINNVTYSGGDVVSITDGTNTSTLEYYTDKLSAIGDYLYLFQFVNYGGFYFKPTHLEKAQTNNGTTINFAYEFDANGNVSKLTTTSGSNIDIYHLTYFCD